MNLMHYLTQFRRRWRLFVALILVGVASGAAYAGAQPPVYVADARSFVSIGDATSVSDLNQGTTFTQDAVQSYAQVASSPYVLDEVIKDLKLGASSAALQAQLSATAELDTSIISISVRDTSPSRAAAIANSAAVHLAEAVATLTSSTDGLRSAVHITQIQRAAPPASATEPRTAVDLVVGLLAGLLAGVVAVLTVEIFDNRIRTVADVKRVREVPALGGIPWNPDAARDPALLMDNQHGAAAEAYRAIRTNLQFIDRGRAFRGVVTSSVASEGKTTTVVNLGAALALSGKRVLLIDADLRRPRLADFIGLDGSVGLTEVLAGQVSLSDALQEWGPAGLSIVPSGAIPPNPSELLQSDEMENLLEDLDNGYDYVLFDAPPILAVADAAILGGLIKNTLVICGARRVRRQQLQLAFEALENVHARVVGVVVTMLATRGPDAYSSGGYGYGYSNGNESQLARN